MTQAAQPLKVGNLRTWIGDGFGEEHFGIRADRSGHCLHIGRVNQRNFYSQQFKRTEQAIRIAKNKLARKQMVPCAQERCKQRGKCTHPGGKRQRRDTVFHFVDFLFKSIRRGCPLPGIGVTRFALKHSR